MPAAVKVLRNSGLPGHGNFNLLLLASPGIPALGYLIAYPAALLTIAAPPDAYTRAFIS